MGGYAPRAREDSVRPRRLVGASGRPLNFSVRARATLAVVTPRSYNMACSLGTKRSDAPT